MSKIIETMDCDIVRDLLPLYCDDIVSKATSEAVEAHLARCENCRKEYEQMTAELPDELKAESTKRIFDCMMHRERTNRVLKSLASAILVCVIVIGGFFVQRDIPVVKESPENIRWCHVYRIDTDLGKRFVVYHNEKNYNCIMSRETKLSSDGKTLELIMKKALIAIPYENSDSYVYGTIVNESDPLANDVYSYFSKEDIDYSKVETVKLNGKTVWTLAEDGNKEVPEFVKKNISSEWGILFMNGEGISMDLENGVLRQWNWDGNVISDHRLSEQYPNKKERETQQSTAVTAELQ